jgi:hypothetical protein
MIQRQRRFQDLLRICKNFLELPWDFSDNNTSVPAKPLSVLQESSNVAGFFMGSA